MGQQMYVPQSLITVWTDWPYITQLCGLCCVVNPMWTDWPHITVLCGLCCVVNPMWTDWPHITQLCGLCCVEESTARLVYWDSVLPITAKEERCNYKNVNGCKEI